MAVKKTLKYHDFEEVEREVTYYFSLTPGEILEWDLVSGGSFFHKKLEAIGESGDPALIIPTFKDLIRRSVAELTPNGGLKKSEDISMEFEASAAYSDFFVQLVTNAAFAADFVNNVIPKAVLEEAKAKNQNIGKLQERMANMAKARTEESSVSSFGPAADLVTAEPEDLPMYDPKTGAKLR